MLYGGVSLVGGRETLGSRPRTLYGGLLVYLRLPSGLQTQSCGLGLQSAGQSKRGQNNLRIQFEAGTLGCPFPPHVYPPPCKLIGGSLLSLLSLSPFSLSTLSLSLSISPLSLISLYLSLSLSISLYLSLLSLISLSLL